MFTKFLAEAEKVRKDKIVFYSLILFLSFSSFALFVGSYQYRASLEVGQEFLKFENLRVQQYNTYEQYAAKGFRYLWQLPAVNIFVDSNRFLEKLTASVDTSEVISIVEEKESAHPLQDFIYLSFNYIFVFLGTFIATLFGVTTFPDDNALAIYQNTLNAMSAIISRLIIMLSTIFFYLLLAIILLPLLGVADILTPTLCLYFLYILMIMVFFLLLGVLISRLIKRKKKHKIWLATATWVVSFLIIPAVLGLIHSVPAEKVETHESLCARKLKRLMNFEKESAARYMQMIEQEGLDKLSAAQKITDKYIMDVLPENNTDELKFFSTKKDDFKKMENVNRYFPPSYFPILAGEVSGSGIYNREIFLSLILNTRSGFIKFYIGKRFTSKKEAIESYIRSEMTIFKGLSMLPDTFPSALIVLWGYILLMLIVIFIGLKKHFRRGVKTKTDIHAPGVAYFYLYSDDHEKSNILSSLKSGDAAVISSFRREDVNINLGFYTLIAYFSRLLNVAIKDVEVELLYFDIFDKSNVKTEVVTDEVFKAIYLIFVCLSDKTTIVLDDFLKGERPDFNRLILNVLDRFRQKGKTIIYLSNNMYLTCTEYDFMEKHKLKNIRINLSDVSFK